MRLSKDHGVQTFVLKPFQTKLRVNFRWKLGEKPSSLEKHFNSSILFLGDSCSGGTIRLLRGSRKRARAARENGRRHAAANTSKTIFNYHTLNGPTHHLYQSKDTVSIVYGKFTIHVQEYCEFLKSYVVALLFSANNSFQAFGEEAANDEFDVQWAQTQLNLNRGANSKSRIAKTTTSTIGTTYSQPSTSISQAAASTSQSTVLASQASTSTPLATSSTSQETYKKALPVFSQSSIQVTVVFEREQKKGRVHRTCCKYKLNT